MDQDKLELSVQGLTEQVLNRLDRLEVLFADLPGQPGTIGHNVPPEEIGLLPYYEVDQKAIKTAIDEVRETFTQTEPDTERLEALSRRFDGWGMKIGQWMAKKADLAVDVAIKNGMKLAAVGVLLHELGHDLSTLAKHLLAHF